VIEKAFGLLAIQPFHLCVPHPTGRHGVDLLSQSAERMFHSF